MRFSWMNIWQNYVWLKEDSGKYHSTLYNFDNFTIRQYDVSGKWYSTFSNPLLTFYRTFSCYLHRCFPFIHKISVNIKNTKMSLNSWITEIFGNISLQKFLRARVDLIPSNEKKMRVISFRELTKSANHISGK